LTKTKIDKLQKLTLFQFGFQTNNKKRVHAHPNIVSHSFI